MVALGFDEAGNPIGIVTGKRVYVEAGDIIIYGELVLEFGGDGDGVISVYDSETGKFKYAIDKDTPSVNE